MDIRGVSYREWERERERERESEYNDPIMNENVLPSVTSTQSLLILGPAL